MDKIFSVLHAYRPAGATTTFLGNEACMFVPLKNGWFVTIVREKLSVLKIQLSRNGARESNVETIGVDEYNRLQQILYLCKVE